MSLIARFILDPLPIEGRMKAAGITQADLIDMAIRAQAIAELSGRWPLNVAAVLSAECPWEFRADFFKGRGRYPITCSSGGAL